MNAFTDFSRLKELHYRDVSSGAPETDVTFIKFLKKALTVYHRRYLRDAPEKAVKTVSFEQGSNKVGFKIFGHRHVPYPHAVLLSGHVPNLDLLETLKGDITVEFSGMKMEKIPEPSRTTVARFKKGTLAPMGVLNVFFSGDNSIKKMTLQPDISEITNTRTIYSANERVLAQTFYGPLKDAERIHVSSNSHIDDDVNRALIQERCAFLRDGDSFYVIYTMKSPSETASLEEEAVAKMLPVYLALSHNFNPSMVPCLRIE